MTENSARANTNMVGETDNEIKNINTINDLFNLWKKAQHKEDDISLKRTKVKSENITRDHFCEDGIIDKKIFENEKKKVLFITNEANDAEYTTKDKKETSRIKDFNKYYTGEKKDFAGQLIRGICVLYKVITNSYNISEQEIARNFAFMNLNKRGGGNKSKIGKDDNHLEEYCKYYAKYIKKEIEIINPDIIVWVGKTTYYLNKYIGGEQIEDKTYLKIENKNVPVLKVSHTSGAWKISNSTKVNKNISGRPFGKLATEMEMELQKYNLI